MSWRGEESRLQCLHSFGLLDTGPEPSIDATVREAARATQTPMALLSLVDRERQFFKARVGIECSEAPRPWSFCVQAIQQPDLFVVEDAHRDERFSGAPMVQGPPFIRFYAGMPLRAAEGVPIGMLCALDTKPRGLSHEQRAFLEVLAQKLMLQLELRRADRLRDFTVRTIEGALREELGEVRRSATGLLPARGAASTLLHAQRAEDLVAELASLRAPWLPLSRHPIDLAELLRDLAAALEAGVGVDASGDCVAKVDADHVSQAVSRLCEEALERGRLTVAVQGEQDAVRIDLGGVVPPLSDSAAWLTSEEGGTARALGRRLAERVVLAHGGRIEAHGSIARLWLPR